MSRVSIIILTKNRVALLEQALRSLDRQTYLNAEIVVVNDGSTDGTGQLLSKWKAVMPMEIINHAESRGITKSRQEALEKSHGELVAFLDDDDEWIDTDKLKKQVAYMDGHPECVLVGGGIKLESRSKNQEVRMRPETDRVIRRTMLFRNNFFTSTVMIRRSAALAVGGFFSDGLDFAEDYDLWLRLGERGCMYNFQEVFTQYRLSAYDRKKIRAFLEKQLILVKKHRETYPFSLLASAILKLRILI